MCCIQLDHHLKPSLRYGAIGLGRHTNKGHGAMAVSKFQRSAFGSCSQQQSFVQPKLCRINRINMDKHRPIKTVGFFMQLWHFSIDAQLWICHFEDFSSSILCSFQSWRCDTSGMACIFGDAMVCIHCTNLYVEQLIPCCGPQLLKQVVPHGKQVENTCKKQCWKHIGGHSVTQNKSERVGLALWEAVAEVPDLNNFELKPCPVKTSFPRKFGLRGDKLAQQ